MNETDLQSIRKTRWLGKSIHFFDRIDSTNAKAKELAENGAKHGTLVVADSQSAGRGRLGRTWESQEGTGIFMTLILKPEVAMDRASMITLVTALAVAHGIKEVTGADVKIKWPNDIVLHGKKICGILTEMIVQPDNENYLVVGIGINVHNKSFPKELVSIASSLHLEGYEVHRVSLIEKMMEHFEVFYEKFLQTEDLSPMLDGYQELLVNKDKAVRVLDFKEPFDGTAKGITKRGELIVDTGEGTKLVSSGEVSVRGIYGYV